MGILPYNAEMGGEILYCGEPLTEKESALSEEKRLLWFLRALPTWIL